MEKVQCTIIGAGVIGLAIAAELSLYCKEIFILEKNKSFGQETSSRNSEVIHSSIYYPQGSLKHLLCLEGCRSLYELCQKESIPHRRLGKLIIATQENELEDLEHLFQRAVANGVPGIKLLEQSEVRRLEPYTRAIAGIYSPWTGIINTHALMKFFLEKSRSKGVEIAYQSEVNLLQKQKQGFLVGIRQDEYRFSSDLVINCAGLFADRIAGLTGLDLDEKRYRLHYCKGDYFAYAKASPVSRLVYPLPHKEGISLGVHATLDMGGRLRFGPDAEYVTDLTYRLNEKKAAVFYLAAQRIIPGLDRQAIIPDTCGIRPKLQGPNDSFRDFIIREESDQGLPGFINLIGIESPGLTSCLAIAKKVARLVAEIS